MTPLRRVCDPIWLPKTHRWQLRYQQQGARRCEYFSVRAFGSREAAKQAARHRQAALSLTSKPTLTPGCTFNALADLWLAEHKQVQNPAEYRTRLAHARACLGPKPVRSISEADISALFAHLMGESPDSEVSADGAEVKRRPLAPKTARHVLACVRAVFELGIKRALIQENPAASVHIDVEHRTCDLFGDDEIATMLEAARGTWLELALRLVHDTALRPGELCALRWDDIRHSKIHIHRAIGNRKRPKTKAGRRPLVVSPPTADLLARARQESRSAWVFPSPSDPAEPLDVRYLDKAWTALLATAGIRHRRFYDMRHTTISVAMATIGNQSNGQRLNLADIAEFAGHSQAGTTLQMYTHALGSAEAVARGLAALRNARN